MSPLSQIGFIVSTHQSSYFNRGGWKMSKLGLTGLLGGTLLLSAGTVWANNDTVDDKLEKRVETAYSDAKMSSLNVDVEDGVVTLTGEVATTADKTRAERVARKAGARRVVNKLVIDTDKTAARIEDRAEAKKEAIDDRAERQKEAVDRQAEAAKDRLDRKPTASNPPAPVVTPTKDKHVVDPWVTTKVKTKILADDLLDKSEINVDTTNDGVVTLKGTVPSVAAETRALELARMTEGVRTVVDRLEVKAR
jgi:osmotically-inducible protein OsmY